ncbi:hypothetical protein [Synechococcus phage Ssp-JY42]|nr:transcription regulatory protein [Synechococcus phage Yong-M4-211]
MSRTYSVRGLGSRILTHLSASPNNLAGIRSAIAADVQEGRAIWHCLGALIEDGLVDRSGPIYVITAEGLDALAVMDAGHPFTAATPGVRYFPRAAA